MEVLATPSSNVHSTEYWILTSESILVLAAFLEAVMYGCSNTRNMMFCATVIFYLDTASKLAIIISKADFLG